MSESEIKIAVKPVAKMDDGTQAVLNTRGLGLAYDGEDQKYALVPRLRIAREGDIIQAILHPDTKVPYPVPRSHLHECHQLDPNMSLQLVNENGVVEDLQPMGEPVPEEIVGQCIHNFFVRQHTKAWLEQQKLLDDKKAEEDKELQAERIQKEQYQQLINKLSAKQVFQDKVSIKKHIRPMINEQMQIQTAHQLATKLRRKHYEVMKKIDEYHLLIKSENRIDDLKTNDTTSREKAKTELKNESTLIHSTQSKTNSVTHSTGTETEVRTTFVSQNNQNLGTQVIKKVIKKVVAPVLKTLSSLNGKDFHGEGTNTNPLLSRLIDYKNGELKNRISHLTRALYSGTV